ncbi:MAG: hypothetical protein EOO61_03790 [Hymenobacter sp.]|nr:MAG: hypothetical protein EOO61_03790 [Hymenobacter sp.]
MTNSTIQELIKLHRSAIDSPHAEQIRGDFEKVLEIFVAANYPEGVEGNTLMCSIHDSFPSHHSCIACNLQDNVRLLERFLLQAGNVSDIHFTFTTFLLLLYLIGERIQVYIEMAELPESYRLQHFGVIQEIRHWANFIKHPKAFMLVVHPQWEYEESVYESSSRATKGRVTIDTAFVKDNYRHEADNKALEKVLARQNDVVVLFPNPISLMSRFVEMQQRFIGLISENKFVRDMLERRTKERHEQVDPTKRRGTRPVDTHIGAE